MDAAVADSAGRHGFETAIAPAAIAAA